MEERCHDVEFSLAIGTCVFQLARCRLYPINLCCVALLGMRFCIWDHASIPRISQAQDVTDVMLRAHVFYARRYDGIWNKIV